MVIYIHYVSKVTFHIIHQNPLKKMKMSPLCRVLLLSIMGKPLCISESDCSLQGHMGDQ